eukprot:ctg_2769.g459
MQANCESVYAREGSHLLDLDKLLIATSAYLLKAKLKVDAKRTCREALQILWLLMDLSEHCTTRQLSVHVNVPLRRERTFLKATASFCQVLPERKVRAAYAAGLLSLAVDLV